ncbi:MAG: AmmeMemoRadiSam system radical SAM enzyme [Desulfovibrionaceae bacterium]|nr:AmmeMemoRadiSam system radical SAM enzyme [Desulfovibrionaceae bacterium]
MLPSLLWRKTDAGHVSCLVCSHKCVLKDGAFGVCKTRMNKNGRLVSLLTDVVSSVQIDPIEKKPLYHFLPASTVFSVGSSGCNFRCSFCQNSHISVIPETGTVTGRRVDAQTLLDLAVRHATASIAFTYNEPTLSVELINETAQRAASANLPVVLVTNGYMSQDFLELIGKNCAAMNVDLKSFSDDFYREYCGARLLPVLDTLKALAKTNIWFEVTTLVIPGVNDSPEELRDCAQFICNELGVDTPWHLSAFFGAHKMRNHPATSPETLQMAWEIGKDAGLHFVYMGNIVHPTGANTYCPDCGALLIERTRWNVVVHSAGKCPACGCAIAGVWH